MKIRKCDYHRTKRKGRADLVRTGWIVDSDRYEPPRCFRTRKAAKGYADDLFRLEKADKKAHARLLKKYALHIIVKSDD